MLVVKKEERETLHGVLKHPWITMTSDEVERLQSVVVADIQEPHLKRRKSVAWDVK